MAQIKEDTVKPSVPAWEFNLKAYAAIAWHNDPASLGLEPRVADQSENTTLNLKNKRTVQWYVKTVLRVPAVISGNDLWKSFIFSRNVQNRFFLFSFGFGSVFEKTQIWFRMSLVWFSSKKRGSVRIS